MANNRLKRHKRIRRKVSGSINQPRVSVFRSNKHIQVQLINDDTHTTIAGMSTLALEKGKNTKSQQAQLLGELFAKKVLALEEGKYKKVVFDRGGYKYHGRIKAVADGMRENGLVF